MYLIDTSVWVLHFNRKVKFDLKKIAKVHEMHICLPIYYELIDMVENDENLPILHEIFLAMNFIENPMSMDLYNDALNLSRLVKNKKGKILPENIALKATCALKNDLIVLHSRKEFNWLKELTNLKQEFIEK